jgi:hypothetical protein
MVDYPIFIVRTASDARDLLATLRRRELEETATRLSAEMGLAYQPAAPRATALRACIGRGSP